MVQVFRKNWFVFTLLLFPYTILTRVWIFFDSPEWPVETQDFSLVFSYIKEFLPQQYLWNVILASFIIFFNAVQLNHLVIKNRMSREINLFPGMLFILFTAFHKDMFWLSPHLLAITFLIASISNIFRIYQKPFASLYIFNAGFLLGIATIIHPQYIIFFIFLLTAILTLRKLGIRDIIQLLISFFVVFYFISFLRFWNTGEFHFFIDFKNQFNIDFALNNFNWNEWIVILVLAILFFTSISNYRKYTIKKSIQSQKKVNLIYWALAFSFVIILFSLNRHIFSSLFILLIPLSIFSSMWMNRIKNEAALEVIHFFILFFIIFSHFWF